MDNEPGHGVYQRGYKKEAEDPSEAAREVRRFGEPIQEADENEAIDGDEEAGEAGLGEEGL
jgi:hypothetical protein